MPQAVSMIFTLLGGFLLTGLIFAWNKERKGEGKYLLFWPNRISQASQKMIGNATFQGPGSRLARIFFVAIFTLISAQAFFESFK